MDPYHADRDVTLYHGNALTVLAELPDQSVQTTVTSPPYLGLRDYGVPPADWPAVEYAPMRGLPPVQVPAMTCCLGNEGDPFAYVGHMLLVLRQVGRVLRRDGTVWLNIGDSYSSKANGGASFDRHRGPGHRPGVIAAQVNTTDHARYKSLLGVPWRLAFALQADGWTVRNEIIWNKCLSGGAQVYARTNGDERVITVKDLARCQPGTVELWTGQQWSRMLRCDPTPPTEGRELSSALAKQARYRGKPVPPLAADLEIEFRNGERVGCTPNHKWPTMRGTVRADELTVGDVVRNCRTPSGTAAPAGLDDDVVGWFVGLYVAEGSRSGSTIQISSHTKETARFDRLRMLATAYHGTCVVHQLGGNTATANLTGRLLDGILDTYVGGRTAKDKHLTARCWQRSDAFIRAVLDGYLSGDAHYDTKSDRWRLGFCDNDSLARDLRALAARLGYSLRLIRCVHTFNGREFPGWRGTLVTDPGRRRRPDSEVIAIRQSRARQFWNIEIEDEPHQFALASGILTCNSNAMPESVQDRLSNRYERVFLLTRSNRYWFNLDPIREALAYPELADGSRVFGGVNKGTEGGVDATERRRGGNAYGVRPDPTNYPDGQGPQPLRAATGQQHRRSESNPLGRNPGDVWSLPTQPFHGSHYAVMAPTVAKRCVLAGSPEGGVVLDPFVGACTTMMVARQTGRHGVGIDLSAASLDIGIPRIGEPILDFDIPVTATITDFDDEQLPLLEMD